MKKVEKKSMSIIIKTIERCNINCTYCYFFNGVDKSYLEHPYEISLETVHEIALFILKGIEEVGANEVHLILHGGEPLMQNKNNFDAMCRIFKDSIDPKAALIFSLQTNAILISEEWLKLFDKFEINVGVSIDGPEEYHDKYRLDKRGRGTHAKVIKGIKLLSENLTHQSTRQMGSLSVINPDHCPKRIYRYFVDELKLQNFDFLMPDYTYDTPPPHPASAYGKFLIDLFSEWTKDNNSKIKIRFFSSILACFFQGSSTIYGVGQNNTNILPFVTIASNGDLSPVDELRSASPKIMYDNSNIANTSYKACIESPRFLKLNSAQLTLARNCLTCCWKKVCGGGGLINRFKKENEFDNPSLYCEGLKDFYADVAMYLLRSGLSLETLANNIA